MIKISGKQKCFQNVSEIYGKSYIHVSFESRWNQLQSNLPQFSPTRLNGECSFDANAELIKELDSSSFTAQQKFTCSKSAVETLKITRKLMKYYIFKPNNQGTGNDVVLVSTLTLSRFNKFLQFLSLTLTRLVFTGQSQSTHKNRTA